MLDPGSFHAREFPRRPLLGNLVNRGNGSLAKSKNKPPSVSYLTYKPSKRYATWRMRRLSLPSNVLCTGTTGQN
jgi:hypothetical protein